ncbi:MAG: hypothetical protein ABIN97_02225 [Ginsengibacter sp.]
MKSEIFNTSSIVYLKNKDIDRAKWDKCIDNAPNGLIYAYSFYLDAMAKHWDALVLNDYEVVMPVTWNKKYGICYLYQPFLCASLGLFGDNLSSEMLSIFLNKIPKRFKYRDIYLNAGNNFATQKYGLYTRTNYTLALNKPYSVLLNNFRNSYKQIIKKTAANKLEIKQNINVEEIIVLEKIQLGTASKIKNTDWQNFAQLYKMLLAKTKAINYGIYLRDELLASGIFLFSKNRAYYLLAGNIKKGRPLGASHLVINTFIQHHAGKNLILDFVGSNIPGIAFFFKGFGAQVEEYPGIKYNALPPILRSLKKYRG